MGVNPFLSPFHYFPKLILESEETQEEFTLLVKLNSVPTANVMFPSLPAGMINNEGTFSGNMAREIKEETGLVISEKNLIDLTELAYGARYQGVYPSVGGTDEFIRLFVFKQKMPLKTIQDLDAKTHGLAEENEKITLEVVPLKDLWRVTSDGKALAALTLYHELKKARLLTKY